jgi:DNA modification methylase
MSYINEILEGDVLQKIGMIPDKAINTCISSPPYYALRDYGIEPSDFPEIVYTLFGFPVTVKAQKVCLGLEATPFDFIGHLVYIYRLVAEKLSDDGTIWVNIGDSYSAEKKQRTDEQAAQKSKLNGSKQGQIACATQPSKIFTGLGIKPKDMLGIPWMLLFALRGDGWYARQDIIWHKRNCMPESCKDRCTKNHEYIFLLSKKRKYYFDAEAIKTKQAESTKKRLSQNIEEQIGSFKGYGRTKPMKAVGSSSLLPDSWSNSRFFNSDSKIKDGRKPRPSDNRGGNQGMGNIPNSNAMVRKNSKYSEPIVNQSAAQHRQDRAESITIGANKRSVWSIATQGFKEAHFATFPEKLIEDCIKASTSEYGHCVQCGKGWRRITEKELIPGHKAAKTFVIDERDQNADVMDAGSNRAKDEHKSGHINRTETMGWVKDCKCHTDDVKPGIVMDMFGGSGTTGIVAVKLNRSFTLIEKSIKYIPMMRKRFAKELGMFNPLTIV